MKRVEYYNIVMSARIRKIRLNTLAPVCTLLYIIYAVMMIMAFRRHTRVCEPRYIAV